MKIVIDIPKDVYEDVMNDGVLYVQYEGEIARAIRNSIRYTRPKGRWTTKRGSMIMTCTNCGKDTWYSGRNDYIFCPNCGAKMESEDKHISGKE